MLTHKGAAVTDQRHVCNIFNDYFISFSERTKSQYQAFEWIISRFLHHANDESSLIAPTDTHELNLITRNPLPEIANQNWDFKKN